MAQSDFLRPPKKARKKKKTESVSDEQGQQNGTSNELLRDPFEVLGSDLLMTILSYVDARSVALSLLVSRSWYAVASSDRLWSSKCMELWLGKAHIPRLARTRSFSRLAAYSLSIMDGKRLCERSWDDKVHLLNLVINNLEKRICSTRTPKHGIVRSMYYFDIVFHGFNFLYQTRIMREDLCAHAWQFHFNKEAPIYWRNLDPYWQGSHPLMRRYFHPDGSQTADPDDRVWGGHECCFSTVTSFIGDGEIREHYVRINRWPRMFVSRNEDWSWKMSNHFTSYSSIADADKDSGTGPLNGW